MAAATTSGPAIPVGATAALSARKGSTALKLDGPAVSL